MHESILLYRGFRYLKIAVGFVAISAFLYAYHDPIGEPNGGTWLGYSLGTISGILILWLSWFGVRKRIYGPGKIKLEAWLSAHVYLGVALAIVATLHSGFQIGWNVHALLYVVMMVVILSGLVGVYFYVRYPSLIAENRRGHTTEMMLTQIADLDREMKRLAMNSTDQTMAAIMSSVQETSIGASFFSQLRGYELTCPTTLARKTIEAHSSDDKEQIRRQILSRIVRKEEILKRVRKDVQMRSWMRIWLYVHVPFTFATIAALAAHVVIVFYYW